MERYDEFRRAYELARVELTKIPSVIGVGHGPRLKDGRLSDEYVIIAYVDQKLPLDQLPASERVPSTFEGWPVDVRAPILSEAHAHADSEPHVEHADGEPHDDHDDGDEHDLAHAHSHDGMFLDWGKLHERYAGDAVSVEAADEPFVVAGHEHVAVIPDDGRLVLPDGRVDFVAAFKRFKRHYGDVYDFVSFFLDRPSGMPDMGTFHSGIYNQTRGINYYAGDRLDARRAWGSSKLQAFHCFSFITMGALLQEMGHMWGGYVTVKYRGDDPQFHFDLLIGDNRSNINEVAHWGRAFNDLNSPMDYDNINWSDNGDGTFTLNRVGDDRLEFCDLDLYLMGLMQPYEVKPFFVLRDISERGEGLVAAQRRDLTVQNVIWAHGPRQPDIGQTKFRQAFVVLTKNAEAAAPFVEIVDHWRQAYETAFAHATRERASVDTTLVRAPMQTAPPNFFLGLINGLVGALRRLFGGS